MADWKRFDRCGECGVDARRACRDRNDMIADTACEGRPRFKSENLDPQIAVRLAAAGRPLCTVCRTRAAVAHDVCGRRACRERHVTTEVRS